MSSGPVRKAKRTSRQRRRGFTLIEAMAAVVLLGIGIVAAMGSFSTLTRTEDRVRQTEYMQRLAQTKLAELESTGQAGTSTNGDFSEQNEPDYTWELEVNTSGITDLNAVILTVKRTSTSDQTKLHTLVYVPPVTTTTGANP